MVNEAYHSLAALSAEPLFPLVLYTLVAVFLVAVLLAAARFPGARRPGADKETPYESGIVPTGSAGFSYPAPFYLVAIFFIVFDVEAVFIFTWGVAREQLGLDGLIHITLFILVLLAGLGWLWMKGGLDWGPRGGSRAKAEKTEGTGTFPM